MPNTTPRRSPEVEAVITRIWDAFTGDMATLARLAPPSQEFLAIGTDPTEWWGADGFLQVMEAQMSEMGEFTVSLSHLEAYELGSVAWSASRARVDVAGTSLEMRVTAVLVLDAGVWRLVQWHASEGVANEESLGFSLTTTLTDILDSLDLDTDLGALPEQGMSTLMFTDVEGSTGHAKELGDRRYTQLMTEHLDLVRRLAQRSGGQVIKAVGDGALLAFTSTRSAVACAVAIQRETADLGVPYAIRIGVHAGDVVRTDSDVMGFAVNKAARVTSAAGGGQIVVSSVVRELVGHDNQFAFGTPFLAELRGIDGIHELVTVEWSEAPAALFADKG